MYIYIYIYICVCVCVCNDPTIKTKQMYVQLVEALCYKPGDRGFD